jgi:microsomal dipeptidase-like Zn-dependent dipeptidase
MERFDTSFSTNNNYRCVIAKGYNDIKNAVNESSTHTIVGVMNIEGAHALGCGYHKKDGSCDPLTAVQENTIRANVITLKTRNTPILYLTFCHHFYNQLCGHCKSLPGIVADIADQTYGENFPLTDFGEEVITMLLDPSKGRSIYIDIKHMSYLGRLRYFQMIKENNWNVPIIYSHGGANGFTNRDAIVQNNTKLNPADLSLYDNEILAIAHSNGFFGLNIDQRVMSSKSFLNEIKKERIFESKEKRQYIWSSILFENIKYIAELFERNAINPWDYMCLGTDFDGAIHPINFFLQESDLPLLASCLQQHIVDYYTNPHCPISQDHRLSPELVINKIMYGNAQAFLEKWF